MRRDFRGAAMNRRREAAAAARNFKGCRSFAFFH
jgi:hypothetical protein